MTPATAIGMSIDIERLTSPAMTTANVSDSATASPTAIASGRDRTTNGRARTGIHASRRPIHAPAMSADTG